MNNNPVTDEVLVEQTRAWLASIVVNNDFCPFAKRELDRGSIHYAVIRHNAMELCLEALLDECRRLDEQPGIETTLLIFPEGGHDFEEFLTLLEISDALLADQGYEGIYQMASFHPDYCFEGVPQDDPANYTNRSPYPMLHILREASVERVLADYPDPGKIPERNIDFCRKQGIDKMRAMLMACRQPKACGDD